MRAATLYDARKSCGPESNAATLLGADAGFAACDRALQARGGQAFAKECPIEGRWCEVRLLRRAQVSQERGLNFISNKVLGAAKSC